MDKLFFWIGYICLGIIALIVRIFLKVENDITCYMAIINQIAGFFALITILYSVVRDMGKKIRKSQKSMKRLKGILIFSLSTIIAYWIIICWLYGKYSELILNDCITICTLTIALTTGLYESILKAIFDKG